MKMGKMSFYIKAVIAMPLTVFDWWWLKTMANSHGKGNLWSTAYAVKLRRNHSFIGQYSCFGNKPTLPHGLSSIFISEHAMIGKNAVIYQNVTIGSTKTHGSKTGGAPSIGDNCFIGAGAVIVGKIHIGDNVSIGAGAVVAIDVPSNTTVVSPRPRIIEHNGRE